MAASRGGRCPRGTAYGRLHKPGVPLISFALPPSKFLPPLRGSAATPQDCQRGSRDKGDKRDKKDRKDISNERTYRPSVLRCAGFSWA